MQHYIITIARSAGCGGKEVGKRLAKLLDIPYYDREIVETVAKQTGISAYDIAHVEEIFAEAYGPKPEDTAVCDAIIKTQAEAIRAFAAESSCVFVGRCADYFLKDTGYPCLNIYLYAPEKDCAKSFIKTYGLDMMTAKNMVKRIGEKRDHYYRYVTGCGQADPSSKQLMLDTSLLGVDATADLIRDIAQTCFGE